MKDYLEGEEAKRTCEEILDQFYVDGTYNKHLGKKGLFRDSIDNTRSNNPGKEVIVAFDNCTGDCWIEQFDNEKSAIRWLQM